MISFTKGEKIYPSHLALKLPEFFRSLKAFRSPFPLFFPHYFYPQYLISFKGRFIVFIEAYISDYFVKDRTSLA